MSKQAENNSDQSIVLSSGEPHTTVGTIRSIYEDIVSKNRELSKIFKAPHVAKFDDFKQIITQLNQAIKQQNCLSQSCTFNIVFLDDVQAQLNSFEEFSKFDTSKNSPVESISIEISYLAQPETDKRPLSSRIEIVLISAIALRDKAAEKHGVAPELLGLSSDISGFAKIEHSNYLIGKFLLSTITEWYEKLDKLETNWLVKMLKKMRGWIPAATRFSFQAIFLIILMYNFEFLFPPLTDASSHFQNIAILLISFLALSALFWRAGFSIEQQLRRVSSASAVILGKADERVLVNYRSSNSKLLRKATLRGVLNLGISALASWLVLVLTRI